ncbi:MAG TPA: sulfatase-like hydrolase/transferase [Opitutaceae bacterium]
MPDRPDILWIVTTQWRASATGYAGDPNARTPHLDALAAAGVNYAQAVTPHPFGPFARAALLTGVESPENGVRDYFDPLPLEARTVAHELAQRGYATGWFGKWHLAPRDRDAPLVGEAHARTLVPAAARGGFEFWEGFEGGFLLNDPWLHGTRLEVPRKFSGYQSDVVCERAARWLGEMAECGVRTAECRMADPGSLRTPRAALRPWFAVVSLEAPHPPYDAPAGGVAPITAEAVRLRANVPPGGEVEAKARRELAGYYAHIEATDRALGGLITAVDTAAVRRGVRPPVIVFTSVHGDMHGAHGRFRKGWPYEESVRVPLVIRGAPAERAGRISADPVSLVDLPVMARAWAEGRAWCCERDHATISMPSVVHLPHQCDRVWRGVRTATSKRVANADGTPWLRFDLGKDPLEMKNLVHR